MGHNLYRYDVGFLCAIKRHLKERVLQLPPSSDVDAFAVGWSNGGFLATLAAGAYHLLTTVCVLDSRLTRGIPC
jgi:hypothetical protein